MMRRNETNFESKSQYSSINGEAKECQDRIQCLEKALGFMQTELDRLQNRPETTAKNSNNNISSEYQEDTKYDKITVLPESSMVMIVDWVNGNWR
jgi:hypothetical protein